MKMKNNLFITIICCCLSIYAYGQRSIQDITITNPLLEEANVEELRDFANYQRMYFKNPKMKFSALIINEKNAKYYKLKGTRDIVYVIARLDSISTDNWSASVKTWIEMSTYPGHTPYVEELGLGRGGGVISFTKGYIGRNTHYMFYQNPSERVTLMFFYISNASDEEKIENMRNILTNMTIK